MSADAQLIQTTKRILAQIDIPPQTTIIKDLMEERRKDQPNIQRIIELIGKDVRVSAATLKQANSPIFGVRHEIVSVKEAVMRLGYQNVFCVIMNYSLRAFTQNLRGKFMDLYWKTSNDQAMISFYIARKTRLIAPDDAYVAGLFLSCGIPVLVQRFPEYEEFYYDGITDNSSRITERELEKFGTNHALAGYVLCQLWKLPEGIFDCILRHHAVEAATFEEADKEDAAVKRLAIVKLAEHMFMHMNGGEDYYEWEEIKEPLLTYVGIDEERIDALTTEIAELLNEEAEAEK